jgi:PAS domain S-box-containing protein
MKSVSTTLPTKGPGGGAPDPGLLLGRNGITILRRTTALGVIGSLVTVVNVVDFNALRLQDALGLAIPLSCTVSYALFTLERLRAAILALIWGIGLSILAITFFAVGARTPGLAFLPVLCVTAAWLLGLRSAVALGITSLAVIFYFVIAESLGYPPPNDPRNALSYALVYLCAFVGVLIVSGSSMASFRTQLQRSQSLANDLLNQVEELCQSEARFSALFKANPVPSSTNDRYGRIFDVNDAWVALTGVSAQEAMGKTSREIGVWSDPAERKAVDQEMVGTGRVAGRPITLTTAGGIQKPFLVYIAPVALHGAQRVVTSLLDQTDRYAAQATQQAAHGALEARVSERTAELMLAMQRLQDTQAGLVQSEKLASLGAMVAGISHELNTPIGTAVTVASTLQGRIADLRHLVVHDRLRRSSLTEFMADSEEMADLILRSIERAATQIRSFKQMSVDRTSERRRQFALKELVHDIVTSTRPTLAHARITIVQEVDTDITCDTLPGPIGQVLTNLIQNAAVHGFDGRVSGTITIHAQLKSADKGTQVVLTVHDDGVGMTEHTLHHAFDPFYTTRLGLGGSGLGLSISHRLASTVLGGSLAVQSTPACGSCFTFCFLQALAPTSA